MRLFKFLALVLIMNLSGCMSLVAHTFGDGDDLATYNAEIFGGMKFFFKIIGDAENIKNINDTWIFLLTVLDFPFSFIADVVFLPYDSLLNFIEVWKAFYS